MMTHLDTVIVHNYTKSFDMWWQRWLGDMKGTQSVENLVLVCFWGPSLDDLWEPGLTCHDLRKNRTVKQQGQLVYCKVHTYRVSVFVSKTFGQCRCVVDPLKVFRSSCFITMQNLDTCIRLDAIPQWTARNGKTIAMHADVQ